MTSMSDTIVIGGGVMGVTTAWELAQRGVRVTLLEATSDLATEASFANGGLLTASMSDPWNSPGVGAHLFKSFFDPGAAVKLRLKAIPSLAIWGLRFLRNSSLDRHQYTTRCNFMLSDYSVRETMRLASQLGIDCEASDHGTLKIFATEAAADGPMALSESLRELGAEYEMLDPNGVVSRDPELVHAKDKIACGIYYKNDAAGDAKLFTRALGEHARRAGVDIRTGCRVSRIIRADGKVWSVSTDDGEIPAGNVVIATGAKSPHLVAPLGVSVPVRPAKGYSVTVDMANWSARPALPVIDDAMHAGFIPLGSQIRLAGTAEFTGFDVVLSQERIDNLYGLFGRVYPHLATQIDKTKAEPWTGFRPMSATGRPLIGPCGPDGLWINTGHGHLGWTMAVGSAKLLVAQMVGDTTPVDKEPFLL